MTQQYLAGDFAPGLIDPDFSALKVKKTYQDSSMIGSKVSVGWVSPSSRGMWGGDALLLSNGVAGTETLMGNVRVISHLIYVALGGGGAQCPGRVV
jgi:hypothetical protein